MMLGRQITLEPTAAAAEYCRKAAGIRLFAWNWALRRWEADYAAWKAESDPELRKKLKPSAKRYKAEWAEVRKTDFPWSFDVTKCAGTQAIIDLGNSYKRAIKEVVEARREKRKRRAMFGFPRLKNKYRTEPSFALWNDQISFTVINGRQYVKLPNFGFVRMRELLPSMGGILGARIRFHRGKWKISVQFDTDWNDGEMSDKAAEMAQSKQRGEAKAAGATDEEIKAIVIRADRPERLVPLHRHFERTGGVDAGQRCLATSHVTASDGTVITHATGPSNALKRRLKKLRLTSKRFNKGLQRKRKKVAKTTSAGTVKTVYQPWVKGEKIELSNRDKRRRQRVQVVQWGIANERDDLLHKASTALVRSCGVLVGENLNIAGMVKGASNPLSLLDSSMGRYLDMVEYKAERDGGLFLRAPRFFPSSKLCSACRKVHADLERDDYEWTCPACGAVHDRDANAAINLEYLARLVVLDDEVSAFALAAELDSDKRIGLVKWLNEARTRHQELRALRLQQANAFSVELSVGGASAEPFGATHGDGTALAATSTGQGETGPENPERDRSVNRTASDKGIYADV